MAAAEIDTLSLHDALPISRRLVDVRHPELERPLLAALEDAQHVARLPDLEARQRLEPGQHAVADGLRERRRRRRVEPARLAALRVALAEEGALQREAPAVVEGGR